MTDIRKPAANDNTTQTTRPEKRTFQERVRADTDASRRRRHQQPE